MKRKINFVRENEETNLNLHLLTLTMTKVPIQMLLSNVGWTTFTMNQCFKEMVTASSATKLVFSLLNPQLEKEDATSAAQFVSHFID